MRPAFLHLVSLAIVAATGSARADSGIYGPKYPQILSEMEKLQKEHPTLVELYDYGKSVQGRTLRLVVVARKFAAGGLARRPALLMTGSTHGNEYLSIEDKLPHLLARKASGRGSVARFINAGGALVFVPILNPDGYANRSRFNANRVDLNRDWDVTPANHKGFQEVETRSLSQILRQLNQSLSLDYRVTVDYHCCIGALLHPWSYQATKLPRKDLEKHAVIGNMAGQLLKVDVGTTAQILGYSPMGTTKDYYYSEYGALAFTYEGRRGTENRHLSDHVSWWEGMVAMIVQELGNEKPLIEASLPGPKVFPTLSE